jgi:hypothetical protein
MQTPYLGKINIAVHRGKRNLKKVAQNTSTELVIRKGSKLASEVVSEPLLVIPIISSGSSTYIQPFQEKKHFSLNYQYFRKTSM